MNPNSDFTTLLRHLTLRKISLTLKRTWKKLELCICWLRSSRGSDLSGSQLSLSLSLLVVSFDYERRGRGIEIKGYGKSLSFDLEKEI